MWSQVPWDSDLDDPSSILYNEYSSIIVEGVICNSLFIAFIKAARIFYVMFLREICQDICRVNQFYSVVAFSGIQRDDWDLSGAEVTDFRLENPCLPS